MRAVSLDLVKPAPLEQCSPRGEQSFADALKATLAEADPATHEGDITPPERGDFEAAIALMGTLAPPMCAPGPPPESFGYPRLPGPVDDEPSLPGAEQPGVVPGDQRILPTGGEIVPLLPQPVRRRIGDDLIPGPPAPPPAPPAPIGDATIAFPPTAPTATIAARAVATVVPAVMADVTAPPTTDLPIDIEVVTGDSVAPPVVDVQPRDTTASTANASTETPPNADGGQLRTGTRLPEHDGDTDTVVTDTSPTAGAEAIAAGAPGSASATPNDGVAKVARTVVQLPAVVSDLAQQARTESSPRRVVIPLDPPALGHVTVEIIVRADSVKVSLQHGDDAAFNALNAQRPAIAAALESNGLHLSGFDVSGNHRQRASHNPTAARHFEALVEQVEPDGALRL